MGRIRVRHRRRVNAEIVFVLFDRDSGPEDEDQQPPGPSRMELKVSTAPEVCSQSACCNDYDQPDDHRVKVMISQLDPHGRLTQGGSCFMTICLFLRRSFGGFKVRRAPRRCTGIIIP